MTYDHEGAKTTFVEQLWGLPEEVLIQRFITAKQAGRSGDLSGHTSGQGSSCSPRDIRDEPNARR